MSFAEWFREWIKVFFKLLTFSHRPHKSERQRQKEREKRKRAERSGRHRFCKNKKTKRRKGGRNTKLLNLILSFFVVTLSVVFLPLGLLDWGYKSAKVKRKKTNSAKRYSQNGRNKSVYKNSCASDKESNIESNTKDKESQGRKNTSRESAPTGKEHTERLLVAEQSAEDKKESSDKRKSDVNVREKAQELPKEQNIDLPKSVSKNTGDQYIRKRMIIAGSSYCDKETLDKIKVGSYLDLVLKTDNEYDKNAVALFLDGEKVGYIPKAKTCHILHV